MHQVQLSIPKPCHQDWNEMTPTQQGRHCNACAKQVIDFTAMSDAEVLHYFTNIKNENVCGRAYPDQLERAISKPNEIKRKLFWHWNYITMLFLFFGKSNNAKAQRNTKVQETIKSKIKQTPDSIKPLTLSPDLKFSQALEGTLGGVQIISNYDYVAPDEPKHVAILAIKDAETMQPLGKTLLVIKKHGTYKTKNESTNSKGIYKLRKIKEYETYTIVASAEGYESKEIIIKGYEFDERKISKQIVLTKKPVEKIAQSTKIILGGVSSVTNNKSPLYIVDNIAASSNALKKINPDNIEKIDVLNAGEAMAIYGAAASEGTIIITTKKQLAPPVYKLLDEVKINSTYLEKKKTPVSATCVITKGEVIADLTITTTWTTTVFNTIATKISGALKIAPNPVQKGNAINLAFKLKENGAYTIQVVSAAGIMLLQKQIFASSKNYTEQLQTNGAWSSGVYYIRMLDTNNKLISTNSFVIQ